MNGVVETPFGSFELSKFKEMIHSLGGFGTVLEGNFPGGRYMCTFFIEDLPEGTFEIDYRVDV